MGALASSLGVEPYQVQTCDYMEAVCYLAPGGRKLRQCHYLAMPPVPEGAVRVVCISDTHNEHASLHLPPGDLLVHSGDCLTESGQRHVVRAAGGVIKKVKKEGELLFRCFAEWFGSQRYPYKVLVAGNHDLVLQGLGKTRVQQILDESTVHGRAIYLEHEDCSLGGVRIFGSPFGHWGSHNDAFLSDRSISYKEMPTGTHIMVTHSPAILPRDSGQVRAKDPLVCSIQRAGVQLHVSGHCHWAHGLYHATGTGRDIPCVVASVCDSKWRGGLAGGTRTSPLTSAEGVRGDPADRIRGGYNLVQPSIVCDLLLPEGRPAELGEDAEAALAMVAAERGQAAGAATTGAAAAVAAQLASEEPAAPHSSELATAAPGPALLFFGSPNDPDFVQQVLPLCRQHFSVDFVDSTDEGLQAVAGSSYRACVAKLGTEGNTSYPILEALRKKQGAAPFIAIHSATAANNAATRTKLEEELGVNYFATPGAEDELIAALQAAVAHQAAAPAAKPALLFFGPANDENFVQQFLPRCRAHFEVDHAATTAEGVQAVSARDHVGCVAKLGTEGNLVYPILVALRERQGSSPFVVIHSQTAAAKPDTQKHLEDKYGVCCFAKPGDEDSLLDTLIGYAK